MIYHAVLPSWPRFGAILPQMWCWNQLFDHEPFFSLPWFPDGNSIIFSESWVPWPWKNPVVKCQHHNHDIENLHLLNLTLLCQKGICKQSNFCSVPWNHVCVVVMKILTFVWHMILLSSSCWLTFLTTVHAPGLTLVVSSTKNKPTAIF